MGKCLKYKETMFDVYRENVWCLQGECFMYTGKMFVVKREGVYREGV